MDWVAVPAGLVVLFGALAPPPTVRLVLPGHVGEDPCSVLVNEDMHPLPGGSGRRGRPARAVIERHDGIDVITGLGERGNAVVLAHGASPGIVSGQGQARVAKSREQAFVMDRRGHRH